VGDVVDALGSAQPSVSTHLRVLRGWRIKERAESSRRY
jgi:DNA-binding transcriptional ArsR family regulator